MGPRPLVLVSVLVLLGLPQDRAAAVAPAPSTAGCDAVDDVSLSPARRTTRAAQLCQGTWAQGADPGCAEDADVVGNHLDDGEVLLPAHVLWDDALLRDRRDLMDVFDSVRSDDLQEDDVRRVPRRAPAAGLVRPARLPRPRTSWSTLPRVAPAAPAASSWGGIAGRPHLLVDPRPDGIAGRPHLPVDDTPEDAPFQYRPPRPAASPSTPSPAPRWQDPFLQDEEGHVTRGGILLPPYRTEDIIATAPRSPRKSESRETPPPGSKPSASRWAAPESAAGRRQPSKGRAWPAAGTSTSNKPASSPNSSASRQPNARSTARRQASKESRQRARAPDASAGKASNSVRAPSEPSAGQQPWPGSTAGRQVSRESGQRAPDTSTGRTSTSRWEPSEPSGGRQPNTRSTAGRQQSAGGRRQTPPSAGGVARAPKSVSVEEELRKAWENIAAHRVNMPNAASPGRVKIKINVQQAQARPSQGRPPQERPPQQRAPALSAAEESRMLADLLIRLARRASEISSRLRDLAGTATAKKACSTAAASTSPGGRRPQQQQRRRRWDSTNS
ncbi:nascent polypeptide-associated complex subunit alpha, muscle-specific form isoform X6 [Frankliniella occidentalis]|nr:nascent polypeptide-associated complex subunit alpha, muscle-specific form isoform X6 [Frankliniella occidentalis]